MNKLEFLLKQISINMRNLDVTLVDLKKVIDLQKDIYEVLHRDTDWTRKLIKETEDLLKNDQK